MIAGNWVVGLLFSMDRRRLVMTRKDGRIPILEGKLNGVGGKIDEGETAAEAMARECHEETGVFIPPEDWQHVLTLASTDGSREVVFFRVFDDLALTARKMEAEEVLVYDLDQLRLLGDDVLADMKWVIPLALDMDLALPVRVTCARVIPRPKG